MGTLETLQWEQQARDRGHAAGSWVFDGNTDAATIRRVLAGWMDGDPEILDMMPAPLSGRWAGESMVELGLEGLEDLDLDVYEDLYAEAFWDEVVRSGRAWLGIDDDCPGILGHDFSGPIEFSRFAGTPHRKCQNVGCRAIALPDDDDGEDQ